jgi:hypothetical protein
MPRDTTMIVVRSLLRSSPICSSLREAAVALGGASEQ